MLFLKSSPFTCILDPTCSHYRITLVILSAFLLLVFLSILDPSRECCNLSHLNNNKKSLNPVSPFQWLLHFSVPLIDKLLNIFYTPQSFTTRLSPHNSTSIAHVKVTFPTDKYNGQSTCKQHWTHLISSFLKYFLPLASRIHCSNSPPTSL